MNALTLLFFFFILLVATSAGAMILSRHVFRSALFLLVCLLSVAALYVLSFAEFLAVTQILIYAGGVLVIIIFGIMLTTRISGRPLIVQNTRIVAGAVAAVTLFALLVRYLPDLPVNQQALAPRDMHATGITIFAEHVLPFEVAGVLLLIALVGAAVITSHLKSKV